MFLDIEQLMEEFEDEDTVDALLTAIHYHHDRSDGRWESQIVIGTYEDGRPKRKSFYGHTSREAAAKRDKWLKENPVNAMNDAEVYEGTEPFSKFADSWLEIKKATVREYTYENTYRTRAEKYLKPYFGDRPMNAITHRDIQLFFVNHINLSMGLQKTLRTILRERCLV